MNLKQITIDYCISKANTIKNVSLSTAIRFYSFLVIQNRAKQLKTKVYLSENTTSEQSEFRVRILIRFCSKIRIGKLNKFYETIELFKDIF